MAIEPSFIPVLGITEMNAVSMGARILFLKMKGVLYKGGLVISAHAKAQSILLYLVFLYTLAKKLN